MPAVIIQGGQPVAMLSAVPLAAGQGGLEFWYGKTYWYGVHINARGPGCHVARFEVHLDASGCVNVHVDWLGGEPTVPVGQVWMLAKG